MNHVNIRCKGLTQKMIQEKLLINNTEKFTPELYKLSNKLNWRTIKFIQKIIYNKTKNYKEILIKKKSGGMPRQIEEPSNDLKNLQRAILNKILIDVDPYLVSHGFIKGKSIITNAQNHVDKKIILKLDLKDFFHNISKDKVLEIFSNITFNNQCARYLTELCTYKKRLPQGAPTSPNISNIVISNLDKRLYFLSKKAHIVYTRYADDLIFSGDKIKKSLFKKIIDIIKEEGFIVNYNKICWMRNFKKQKVTGLTVNRKVSFGRKNYKNIAGLIYSCLYGDIEEERLRAKNTYKISIKDMEEYLKGMISFVHSINPNQSEKLLIKFKLIPPEKWEEHRRRLDKITKERLFIQVIELINKINMKFKSPFFKGRNERFICLVSKCLILEEFNNICTDINDLFKKIDVSLLGLDESKPIESLEEWLKSKKYPTDKIDVIRDINKLSNNYKRHEDFEKVKKIMEKNGEDLSDPNYSRLIEVLIKKIIIFLEYINNIFKEELRVINR